MNRFTALAAVFLLWAAIYLPGLGGVELKGEEARRILPGVAMLDTGDWLVPHLNGKPYLRKPPLVNWLIATSMKATGERTEWAARLPSVLAMLALGLAMVWTGSRWLGPEGGFTAAIFALTSVALLEKGRLAEIEAVYVACTGIAFAFWLAAWANRETGWRLWLLPGVFLGLGLLAKGPTQLLLFYAIIVPVLVASRETRQLWSKAHLGSLALAVLIFLAWAVPYFQATAHLNAGSVWVDQMKGRVGAKFDLASWLTNFPRALINGLPWIPFAILWWDCRVAGEDGALAKQNPRLLLLVRAARWPFMIGFAGLVLIPGMLPRYTLPIFPAGAFLLALVAPHAAPRWQTLWTRLNRVLIILLAVGEIVAWRIVEPARHDELFARVLFPVLLASFWKWLRNSDAVFKRAAQSALAVAGAMAIYSVAIMPRMRLVEDLRPIGEQVNAAVPANSPLYVIDPGYEPSLFYVRRTCIFVDSARELPTEAGYVLLRTEALGDLKTVRPGSSDALHLGRKGKKRFLLLKLSAESEKTPPRPGV